MFEATFGTRRLNGNQRGGPLDGVAKPHKPQVAAVARGTLSLKCLVHVNKIEYDSHTESGCGLCFPDLRPTPQSTPLAMSTRRFPPVCCLSCSCVDSGVGMYSSGLPMLRKNLQDTTNMLIIADERFVNIQVLIGSELKDWTRIKALPGASNSFTSADGHCQVKFLEHHEMGYGFTSIKRHGFILTRRWAEKGIPSVAQVQCARLPGSRHLFMVLRVKEEAFGTSGIYSRTVG